jgi:pseudaminic acid synthase
MKRQALSIDGRIISGQNPPYVIAEISANHNGSIDRAKKTIEAAKKAGVDAVKIQTYTPDTMTLNLTSDDFMIKQGLWKNRSLYDLYSEAYTPFEWHAELFNCAKENRITLFSSPFDETAVDLLESLATPAYKVASFELVDLPLIKYIASRKKPILLSTGMASLNEICEAIEVAKVSGCDQMGIFHCISSYPAPISEANLSAIKVLQEEFNVQVGLSDHTMGSTAGIVATSLGASIIEKHFTLSRDEGGVDSSFSLEPEEMKKFVHKIKKAYESLGNKQAIRSPAEKENLVFRRSLYFSKDIFTGDRITEHHVRRIRPGYGLEAKYYDEILGAKCLKDAKKGDRVTLKHFRDSE